MCWIKMKAAKQKLKRRNSVAKTKEEKIDPEEKLLELYDQMATQWAQKVEAAKNKA